VKRKEMPEAAIEAYRNTLTERVLALTQGFAFFDGLRLRVQPHSLFYSKEVSYFPGKLYSTRLFTLWWPYRAARFYPYYEAITVIKNSIATELLSPSVTRRSTWKTPAASAGGAAVSVSPERATQSGEF